VVSQYLIKLPQRPHT